MRVSRNHFRLSLLGSIALTLAAGSSSCTRNQRDAHQGHHHHHHSSPQAETEDSSPETLKLGDSEQQELNRVFAINEDLHMAFFNYDAEKVASKSADLAKAMSEVSNPEIKSKLEHSIARLEQIKADRAREDNNQDYHLVSMAMIHLLNQYAISDDHQGYHCPMIKMQWVQNAKSLAKVHNPFAPEMPHCGEMLR